MKLPLSLILHTIKDALENPPEEKAFHSDKVCTALHSCIPIYSRPCIFQQSECHRGLLIYSGDAADITQKLTREDTLICESNSAKHRSLPCKVFTLKNGFSTSWVLNHVHSLFDKWEQWNATVMQMVIEKESPGKILEISEEYFEKPLALMDRNFYIIAISNLNSLSFLDHSPFIRNDYNAFSPNQVNAFKNDPSFHAAERFREPFYWPVGNTSPIPLICSNIVHNDIYCARLLLYQRTRNFHDFDFYLLNLLSHHISSIYITQKDLPFKANITEKLLEKLISGDSLKPKEQNELLSARNWEQNDLFRITLLKLSSEDIANSTMRYFCKEITDRFLHILACEKDNSIVILENLTHEKQHIEKDHQKFMEFIREGNFRAASSNPFYGLSNISSYIKEAHITLSYGNKEKNMTWHQQFNDYALSYFIDKGTEEIDAERICAEEIRILQKYDKENDTQLCRTLRCYLRNKENASKTAKELFIQRGTLLYRLSRIEKLAGIHFDNYEQILFINLSFHILDHIKRADTI